MRIGAIFITGVLAAVGLLPATSHGAAVKAGGLVYSVKGQLTAFPASNEGPGGWSMSGTLTLVNGFYPPGAPKTGTLSASGPLGPATVPTDPCIFTATTGRLKITWPNQPTSKANFAHVMAHPRHTLAGVITSGFGRYSVVVLPLRHNPSGGFTGQLIVGGVAPID